MQGELKPVAWMYSREDGSKDLVLDCNGEYARRLLELGATETPLYAHPPTTNPVVVSETPVGDHQMVDAVARAIMMARDDGGCIVKDWQKEAKDNCHVAQALRQAQAALTAARAQVDGENQRLREALEITAQALLEVEGAQKRGSTWYTNGASGLYQHVAMWVTRGKVAARQALAAGEHRKDAP